MGRRKKKLPEGTFPATIESLSHEGRGISHINDKVTFIRGALPGEHVQFEYTLQRAKFDEGQVTEVITPSPHRVQARCPHFGICGGCSLQHLSPEQQIQHKQDSLLDQLQHIGKATPKEILPPLTGPIWAYRTKARLGVKYVEKKDKVLVGFREYKNSFIADIEQCVVLHPDIGLNLKAFQHLIYGLDARDKIPQLEMACGDNATILILRHLVPLNADDQQRLKEFSIKNNIVFYLQPSGPDTVHPLIPENTEPLRYEHPQHNVAIEFEPSDFTQVNVEINQAMVTKAFELLALTKEDTVLDLFCGLGNFTLPLARYVKYITGIEVDSDLIKRARHNAERHQITNIDFYQMDLAADELNLQILKQPYNKLILDPARSGADVILQSLNLKNIETIVYISCNPATLARDTEILVHQKGYKLHKAGVMDMFPHTTHVESIALFKK